MNRKMRGFTIVELLVVMAIISILAAIVVPNAIKYIAQGRMTRALGDIKSIELSLVKMVADADRSNLSHLFNADSIRSLLGIQGVLTQKQFAAAQILYTRSIYALLREGRAALTDSDPTLTEQLQLLGFTFNGNYGTILNRDVVKKLGTSYLEDIAKDPWGNMYQIWPGPWKRGASINGIDQNPIPFRIYILEASDLPGTKSVGRLDGLAAQITDSATNEVIKVGFSAPRDKIAYIWSYGENLQSSQVLYGTFNDLANIDQNEIYDLSQGEEYMGGGDDVNNWDNSQSWGRFYK